MLKRKDKAEIFLTLEYSKNINNHLKYYSAFTRCFSIFDM